MKQGRRISDILISKGAVTASQVRQALEFQKEKDASVGLGEVLIELGFLTEHELLHILSQEFDLDLVHLTTYPIDIKAVEKIPKQIALKYKAIAVAAEDGHLIVAVNDPLNLYAIEDIRLVTNMNLKLLLAEKSDIDVAIDIHYSELDAKRAAVNADQTAVPQTLIEQLMIRPDGDESPIVRLLNSLLIRGYNTNVSDIHIEPGEKKTVIRMRRDGMLIPYLEVSTVLHRGLTARIKIMAKLDIAEKRKPQDGHFKAELDGMEFHIRVSFMPTVYGEKCVLRFLNTNAKIDYAETFGMNPASYGLMRQLLKNPYGIIYFTGPTGSGKTTTLYSVLQYLSTRPVNITTIEDPVEKTLAGVNQTQVNEKTGITFESGLRTLLRQDPDIIMIGETRDYETAGMSARAAITGHLVFSTLHTNDTVSSVIRLRDLGLENYMISASLAGIVAQRLVRKICPYCKEEYEADEEERKLLEYEGTDTLHLSRGKGCYFCDNTGYRDRTAVYEILNIDSELKRMISENVPSHQMRLYAKDELKLHTLKDEIKDLVLQGITSIQEMKHHIAHT